MGLSTINRLKTKNTQNVTARLLLERFGLKKTKIRQLLLSHFLEQKKPQSHAEILNTLSKKNSLVDSVTLYRNLLKLVQVGLIHKCLENRYKICSHLCHEGSHILLNCTQCEKFWEIADSRGIEHLTFLLAEDCLVDQDQPVFLSCVCSSCRNKVQ